VDTSEYLGLFLDESRENLQTLNGSLLALEKDAEDREALNTIFRVAHSLKGMSATMGFDSMAKLTHKMEEVLTILRDEGGAVTQDTMDTLFACLDVLESIVNDIADEVGEGETDTAPLIERLDKVAQAASGAPAPAPAAETAPAAESTPAGDDTPTADTATGLELTQYERLVLAEAHSRGMSIHRLVVRLEEACMLKAARAYMVLQQLEGHGEVVKTEPSTDKIEQEDFELEFTLWVASEEEAEALADLARRVSEVEACDAETLPMIVEEDEADATADATAEPTADVVADEVPTEEAETETETEAEATPAPPEPTPDAEVAKAVTPEAGRKAPKAAQTVRVGTDRLDSLMNLMGEMVIQRTRLTQLSQDNDDSDLRQAAEEITRVTNDLQLLVMQVRMMPVEAVFMRFPRMVRDLANTLGKKLELVISGEDTELDRTVIDELGDPLVHMLRNAVDHGLETPAERIAAGKPESGTVSLTARHEGNSVVIVVEEDGHGIDPAKLRKAVVAKGLLTESDVRQLTDQEAIELIFMPGFSTAKETTDVSGRGVGMDAVRAKINGLNGSVEINSEIGRGSRFTIRLPLTLAIIQALLVRSAGQTYALPLEATEETVVISRDETRPVGGRECMVLRDRVVPLVELREHLGLDDDERDDGPIQVVVVRVGSARIGVVVDKLLGQQDIVIKHLPDYLGDIVGVAGATILGDGNVALIVDISALQNSTRGVMA
jgi:two-component system, chemotaxis family, sensor kinase CheA